MKTRVLVPEKMDDPNLDPDLHRQALAGLLRINFFSGTIASISRSLIETAKSKSLERISVVDIGSGGGEVAIGVAKTCNRLGLETQVTGWDRSPVAIQTASAKIPPSCRDWVRFQLADMYQPAPDAKFDFAICSLFLHHFENEEAERVLRVMSELVRVGIVVDDLRRTRLGLVLAHLACQLLSRSPIVHFDGPQSVRAAFTSREALELAQRAGLEHARVVHHWPQRFQLTWTRGTA